MKNMVAVISGLLCLSATSLFAESARNLVPHHPTTFDLATVANHFIAAGEEATVGELSRAWHAARMDPLSGGSVREQFGWICRLVFVPQTSPIRSPLFGAYFLLPPFDEKEWPLYPLVEVDGVFFLLAEGYSLAGVAEDPLAYLEFCRAHGVFRKDPLSMPTEKEAGIALERLLDSPAWKKLRWKDSGENFRYNLPEKPVIEFLKAETSKALTRR